MSGRSVNRVVLAAGGTGGHMFPAQALARALLARGHAVTLITDRRGAGFGDDLAEVAVQRIAAGQMAGRGLAGKLKGAASLLVGYVQARGLLRQLGAEAVVGFGGYPSVPTVFAGAHLGLRVVLHEQNAVLGRANRLLAPRADAIATCFGQVERVGPGDRAKLHMTGNPVRDGFRAAPYPAAGAEGPLRLLVTGGSQGARAFNDLVPGAVARLPQALRDRLEVSQQVRGEAELAAVTRAYADCGVRADLRTFFDDVPQRLAAAHLAVTRAGASTIAELAAVGRPALLIPYPYAADDHQTANARALAEAGGAWLAPESSLTAEGLAEQLESRLTAPETLAKAAAAAEAFARPDAAGRLADLVTGAARDNGGNRTGDLDTEEAA